MQQGATTSAGATPEGADADQTARAMLADVLRDQKLRQDRLRHVQAFLTTPAFLDLRDRPVTVSDPPEDIAARRADLDYRIAVLESMLALMIEERDMLERVIAGTG